MHYFLSILSKHYRFLLSVGVWVLTHVGFLNAQPVIYQHNQFFAQDLERQAASLDNSYNASIKPFVNGVNYNKKALDSVYYERHSVKQYNNVWSRKLKQESLLLVDSSNFKLSLDPLFYFEAGQDSKYSDSLYYTNTRGVLIRGSIGNDFAFESAFVENQAVMVDYVSNFVRSWEVVPGQGRVKKFKNNGYDFANASGVITYSPFKHLNIMAGAGKLFVGNGYRSLLLSDNAFNYPYFKINFHSKKWSYTAAWASMQVIKNGRFTFNILSEPIFTKKAYTFQYVSYRPIKRVELGLFQAVMWKAQGPSNTDFDFNILNPVIYAHTLQYNLYDINNVMLGANLNIKATSSINLYGQLMIDDISNNKIGLQAGAKYFDVAGIKNLYVQGEFNKVNAYSYSLPTAYQSFSHYNQALAHPVGANFSELVGLINYRFKDFYLSAKLNLIDYGKDKFGYYAGNSVIRDYVQTDIQANTMQVKANTQIIDIKLGYLVNRSSNLNFAVGAMLRNHKSDFNPLQTNYIYVSIGTAISNKYYDF
jgi:hypothetical protein